MLKIEQFTQQVSAVTTNYKGIITNNILRMTNIKSENNDGFDQCHYDTHHDNGHFDSHADTHPDCGRTKDILGNI